MGNQTSTGPESLHQLAVNTKFTETELEAVSKEFQTNYPDGKVLMEDFKKLYGKFFPTGDAGKFSEHVFRTFDINHDGIMDFKEFIIGLNVTTRGDHEQKLRWAFNLYDVDGNGHITKEEAGEIVQTVYKMTSKLVKNKRSSSMMVEKMFDEYDTNHDGRLSFEEFMNGSKKDSSFVKLLQYEY